jgi:hypothetical protein
MNMSYESGGRASKSGDNYEIRYVLRQILDVFREKIDYFNHEPLGTYEVGVDCIVGHKDGVMDFQQCKGRNNSNNSWTFTSVNNHGLFEKWCTHLNADTRNTVALVSPLSFILLEDLCNKAKRTSNNADDFWNHQINSKESALIDKLFNVWKFDRNVQSDKAKILNNLQRIYIRQFPDSEMKNLLLDEINLLFIGSPEDIYNTFITSISEGVMWSKAVNLQYLKNYLSEKQIVCRNLSNDKRIQPAIDELNAQYESEYSFLQGGRILRNEFSMCEAIVNTGDSAIVHGKAGSGKSGCAQYIASYCKENMIPYIAVRLDRNKPSKNPEAWGQELGLPTSIPHSINSVSAEQKAVIIFDQLDALRWTAAHSNDALQVCFRTIMQVKSLNRERANKISLILVCRTIDMEHDPMIRSLYEKENDEDRDYEWKKIELGELDEEIVHSVVGDIYSQFSARLKKLLSTPSNLYIWQHLDPNDLHSDCSTTSNLINKWWRHLVQKGAEAGISESTLQATKEAFILLSERQGKHSFHRKFMSGHDTAIDFLSSGGLLAASSKNVEFFHQSALDCFVAENMLRLLLAEKKTAPSVIGLRESQTPFKRYQVQILLQDLLDSNTDLFLTFGKELIESSDIRFMIKSVFFDVFSQIHIDSVCVYIKDFIIDYCDNGEYSSQFINNVLFSRPDFVRILFNSGVLEKWMQVESKIDLVARLFSIIRPNYNEDEVAFLRKHTLNSVSNAEIFSWIFNHDIEKGIDSYFELEIEFYEKYPQMLHNKYVDFKKSFDSCPLRCVKLLALVLRMKNKNTRLRFTGLEWSSPTRIEAINGIGREIIEILLPCVPVDMENDYDWTRYNYHSDKLERACIEVIIIAAIDAFGENDADFWTVFQSYLETGIGLHNEIILSILPSLPTASSDKVISYLCSDLNKTLFERTSANRDELLLAKEAIAVHSKNCSLNIFVQLEDVICKYVSTSAKLRLQQRISYNKNSANNGQIAYWSFWGDLQYDILSILPIERLSVNSANLLQTLTRKFEKTSTVHHYYMGHSGGISSPITGKKLSDKQWLRIIFNNKIRPRDEEKMNGIKWIETSDGFVESNLEQYSSEFNSATSNEPKRMIQLILSQHRDIPSPYLSSFFNALAHSEKLTDIPFETLEHLLSKFGQSNLFVIAGSACEIIRKRHSESWAETTLDMLASIVINHVEKDSVWVSSPTDNFQQIDSNLWNITKGKAALAISRLVWDSNEMFRLFRCAIDKLVEDENPAIRLAGLHALYACYNHDVNGVLIKCLGMFEHDNRLIGFEKSCWLLFRIYDLFPDCRTRILTVIESCYASGDDVVIKQGARWMAEAHICYGEFPNFLNDITCLNKNQAESILQMTSNYFADDKYSDVSKEIFSKFFATEIDLENPFSRLFFDKRLKLNRDKDFIISLMKSNFGNKLLYNFARYFRSDISTLYEYQDMILSVSRHMLESTDENRNMRSFENDMSNLIIRLYDETALSSMETRKSVAQECLNLWDIMFEKQIGSSAILAQKILDGK